MKQLSSLLLIIGFLVISLCSAFFIVQAQDLNNPNVEQPYRPLNPLIDPTASSPPLTPIPTPKIVPGSPFSIGNEIMQEVLFQLDIITLAEIVLGGLALMWFIIISITITKKLLNKISSKKLDKH